MQADQIDAELPEPLGDAGGILEFGEVGAESQVRAEEPDAPVIGSIRFKVAPNGVEMAIFGGNLVGRRKGTVETAEVRQTGELILVNRKRVETVLGSRNRCDQTHAGNQNLHLGSLGMIVAKSALVRVLLLAAFLVLHPLQAAMHSGFVRASGQPIPGATVRAISGAVKMVATTDESGMYMIEDLPPGKWVLEVEMFGFKTMRRELEVSTLPTSATWDLEVAGRPTPPPAAAPAQPAARGPKASEPQPASFGFQALTLRRVAEQTAAAAAAPAPDTSIAPAGATEAFLIHGSLSRGLDAPQEEPAPPTPEELARWANLVDLAMWGGSAPEAPPEPVLVASNNPGQAPVPGASKPTPAAKPTAAAKKTPPAKPRTAQAKPSMAAAMSARTSGAPTARPGSKKASGGKFGARTGGGRVATSFGNRRKKSIVQGSAYATLRNSAADASPYSLSGQPIDKPAYAYSRFGVSAGGPLRIPHVYQREGTFVYFSYSGNRSKNPYTAVTTLPSLLERSGDFSQSVTRMPVTIFDLQTGLPFPGNRIPVSRMNPASLGLLPLIPLPTLPGTVQNAHFLSSTGSNSDAISARVNQVLTRRSRLTWSFNFQTRSGQSRQLYGFLDDTSGKGINTDLSWSKTINKRMVNQLKYSLNRNRSETTPYFAFKRNWAAELGINGTSQDPINWGPPNLSFTNFGGLHDAGPVLRRDQSSGVEESLTWVRGKHNWTFGGSYHRNQINSRTDPNARGTFSFSGLLTSGFDSKGNPLPGTGYDFADFLLGLPQSSSIRFGSTSTYFRESVFSAFGQNDWRIHPKLTLNLGVRYEYFSPYKEINKRMANLDIAKWFTGVAVVTPGGEGPYTGKFTEYLVDPDKNNVGPRIGIAWKTPGKRPMTVRAGYGWYYNGSIYGNFATRLAQQPPFANTGTQSTSISRPLTLQNGIAPAPNTKVTNTYAVSRYYEVGYAQTWNLAIQREFPRGVLVELGYLGTKGTHLDLQRLPNRAEPGSPLTAEQRRLIGNAVGFTFESSEANSFYNAAQVRLVRRFHKGVSANLLYTFSKSIDNASTFGGGGTVVAQFDKNLRLERGPSSFDQRHLLQAYYYLASPFGESGAAYIRTTGWKAKLLKDWSLSGGITLRSGTPFTARVLGNRADSGGSGVVGSGRAEATGQGIRDGEGRFFNLAAFGLPPVGRYGNAGRNTVPGPMFAALNLSLGRSFRIRESRRWVDLRVESTNFTNHVSFTSLATVVNSKSYGLPLAAAPMRTLTATLRVRF